MTKIEFERMTNSTVTDEDYKKIEMVYMYFPTISHDSTIAKEQIAHLYTYCNMGMRIIHDMYPTAIRAKELQDKIASTTREIEQLKEQLELLKNGNTI